MNPKFGPTVAPQRGITRAGINPSPTFEGIKRFFGRIKRSVRRKFLFRSDRAPAAGGGARMDKAPRI